MRDTAIERRNLTSAQRIDIILRSSDLIDEIVGQAIERQLKGVKPEHSLASADAKAKKGKTTKQLAEIAKTSSSSVERMQKVKNESPELYR